MSSRNAVYLGIIVLSALLTLLLNISNARRSITLFDPLVDVCNLIQNYYVDETEDEKLITGAINGMLHRLDAHSEYIPVSDVDDFQKQASGSYEGIGISLDSQDGYLIVISPFEDSPAFKAGVRAGDVILEVDGKDAKNLSDVQAVRILTGEAGTSVRLKVLHRDGSEEEVVITRAKVSVPTIRGWRRHGNQNGWDYMLDQEEGIAYIRLTQFTAESIQAFDKAIETCLDQGMDALILDLRSNPGGLMSAAVAIADRFIGDEVIVSTRGAHSSPQVTRGRADNDLPNIPLVVLVDQGSASASEIVAGALQDHRRGIVVGERSWGKGSVQEIFQLPDSGALLKLTTAYYYLPKGRCVHRREGESEWGVTPDIEEKMDFSKREDFIKLTEELSIAPVSESQDSDDRQSVAMGGELRQRLLEADNQLAQAYKQSRGLLRTRPSVIDLVSPDLQ